MWKDPIVEEVRKARKELEKQFDSVDAYVQHIRAEQQKSGAKIVSRSPKKRFSRKAA